MSHFVKIINGKEPSGGTGGISDADLSAALVDFFSKGVVTPTSYKVEEQNTPNMTVKVNPGTAYVPNSTGSMLYATVLDAVANVTINANVSGNPRITAIVIKVDTVTTPNNLASNIATVIAVDGTPAASPSAPNDAAIQSAVGAGNAFYRLGNVTVANSASSITNANIASTREGVILRIAGGYIRYNLATNKLQSSNDGSTWADMNSLAFTGARVYRSTAQSIANSTPTMLTFDGERFDTDTIHDPVTNNSRLTCKTAGKYLVFANLAFAPNSTGLRFAAVMLNGTAIMAGQQIAVNSGSATTIMSLMTVIEMAVNDYVEVQVQQNSGGALNVDSQAYYTPEFGMSRLG